MFLFVLDTINGILIGRAPTLDNDGGEGNDANCQKGQWEEPPVDGRALGKRLKPLTSYVVSYRRGDDEAESGPQGVVAAEHNE